MLNETQLIELAQELAKPPYSSLDDAAAADVLNQTMLATTKIPIISLKDLCAKTIIPLTAGGATNLWLAIKDRAKLGTDPYEMLWDLFIDPDFQNLELTPNTIQAVMFEQGMQGLVDDTTLIFTEQNKTDLTATIMGLATKISLAQSFGWPTVTVLDVNRSRSNYNGN